MSAFVFNLLTLLVFLSNLHQNSRYDKKNIPIIDYSDHCLFVLK